MAAEAPKFEIKRQAFTTDEVAVFLGLHPVTVREMVSTGEIPSFKVRNKRLVHRLVVECILLEGVLGNPDPIKSVRENLVKKHPNLVDGSIDTTDYVIYPLEAKV